MYVKRTTDHFFQLLDFGVWIMCSLNKSALFNVTVHCPIPEEQWIQYLWVVEMEEMAG